MKNKKLFKEISALIFAGTISIYQINAQTPAGRDFQSRVSQTYN